MSDARVRDRVRSGALSTDVTLAGGAAALVAACVLSPAASDAGPVVCPFRLVTGLPCPGCGSVRAWTAFAHGDVAAALGHNPFAVGLFVLTTAAIAWRIASVVDPQRVPRPDLDRILRQPVALAVLGVWVAWGVVRAIGAA